MKFKHEVLVLNSNPLIREELIKEVKALGRRNIGTTMYPAPAHYIKFYKDGDVQSIVNDLQTQVEKEIKRS